MGLDAALVGLKLLSTPLTHTKHVKILCLAGLARLQHQDKQQIIFYCRLPEHLISFKGALHGIPWESSGEVTNNNF